MKNKKAIERVQKSALRVIYGPHDNTMIKLCLTFAKKRLKSEKLRHWFPKGMSTRNITHFIETQGKTKRFSNSAIAHLTRLLKNKIS